MSDLSDALTTALAAVSSLKGETLQYRTTHAGSLTSLTGFVLHRDRTPQPIYATDRQATVSVETGWLKGPLTPAMAIGYEVVDGNGLAWAIESVVKNQQQICAVKASTTQSLGPDRGQTR